MHHSKNISETVFVGLSFQFANELSNLERDKKLNKIIVSPSNLQWLKTSSARENQENFNAVYMSKRIRIPLDLHWLALSLCLLPLEYNLPSRWSASQLWQEYQRCFCGVSHLYLLVCLLYRSVYHSSLILKRCTLCWEFHIEVLSD